MTCNHSSGDAPRNHCSLIGQTVDRRVCFHCSKNTTAGQWPTLESIPIVPVVTANGNLAAILKHMKPGEPCSGCGG